MGRLFPNENPRELPITWPEQKPELLPNGKRNRGRSQRSMGGGGGINPAQAGMVPMPTDITGGTRPTGDTPAGILAAILRDDGTQDEWPNAFYNPELHKHGIFGAHPIEQDHGGMYLQGAMPEHFNWYDHERRLDDYIREIGKRQKLPGLFDPNRETRRGRGGPKKKTAKRNLTGVKLRKRGY